MITFKFLQKNEAEEHLHALFDILYLNMSKIAPTGMTYEEDFNEWYGAVYPAFVNKDARQIILIYDGENLIGFFQYYINDATFVMEEIQFIPEYQGKGVFQKLFARLAAIVPSDIQTVEAYADRRNYKSQGILKHMGLKAVGEGKNGNTYRFRGECQPMLERYNIKTATIYGENRVVPYEKVRRGCRGIVIENGRILVSKEEMTGTIMLPGGGLEEGESLEDCCRRELEEETRYIVEPEKCFLEIDEFYGNYKFVGYYFVCRTVGAGTAHLTEIERERGLVPIWMDLDEFIDTLSRYDEWTAINEDRRGMYLREYTAMTEYFEILKGK